jgi:hypothetical protein
MDFLLGADNARRGKHTLASHTSRPDALDFGGLLCRGGGHRCARRFRLRSVRPADSGRLLRATDVTFDKIDRICAIRRFDVLRVTRTRLAFADITDIRVEIAPMPDDGATISCRLSLVTASAVVPLTASYAPDQPRYNAMRDTVLEAVFEDRPRPAALDPVRMLVKEGRIIDAVTILRVRDGLDLTTASARVDELRKAPDA